MISKSRLNRRLHAIDADLWQSLFDMLAELFKERNDEGAYVVDSLPVAACDNIRIRRCRLYPLEEGKSFRDYIPSKEAAISTVCGYIWLSAARGSRWSLLWRLARRPTWRC